MKTIYCISGLGADEKLFSKLTIDGYELKHIHWLIPQPTESLHDYVVRMKLEINEDNPILMGLSFGGMISIEIAKLIPVKKIFLISSIKTSKELPIWLKTIAKLKLNNLFPLRSLKVYSPIQNYMLGLINQEEKRLAAGYRKNVNQTYLTWAVHQAINWESEEIPSEIHHIHGTDDHIFPIKNIVPTLKIEKAGHFMIMNKAFQISQYINSQLQKG